MQDADEIGFERRGFSPFEAFRFRQFSLFFAGTVIANIAQWMGAFAIGWLAVEIAVRDGVGERASLYVGLTGFAGLVPGFAFGLIGGVAADRFDRRRVLMAARLSSCAVSAALAAFTLTGQIGIASLLLLAALSAGLFSFDSPARLSLAPMLVGPREAFTAINTARMAMQGSNFLGPLVGGLLIGPLGVGGVLVMCTLLWLGSGLGLSGLHARPPAEAVITVGPLESFRQGFAYVRRTPVLRGFTIATFAMALFGSAAAQLLPAVAHDTFQVGAVELSWLATAAGVGSLTGAGVLTTMGGWRRPGGTLLALAFVLGLLLVLFGLQRSLAPALVVIALIGFSNMTYNGGTSSIVQLTVPNVMRGRVLSLHITTIMTGQRLGVLLLGGAGSIIGISNAIALTGIVVLVIAALMSRVAALRDAGTQIRTE